MTDAVMAPERRPGPFSGFVRWFVSDLRGAFSLTFLVALFVISVLGPWISPYAPAAQDLDAALATMST